MQLELSIQCLKENLLILLDSSQLDLDDEISDMLHVFEEYNWISNDRDNDNQFHLLKLKIEEDDATKSEIYEFLSMVNLDKEHHLVARLYQLALFLEDS